MKDFKNITFEIIDINVNATPDIYINKNGITFSRRVLEDLNYPQNVQYSISAPDRVFAIRACKSNESKPAPFSKPRGEQVNTLNTTNKNIVDAVRALLPKGGKTDKRYRVTGHFDSEGRIMYFDMDEAKEDNYRQKPSEEEGGADNE